MAKLGAKTALSKVSKKPAAVVDDDEEEALPVRKASPAKKAAAKKTAPAKKAAGTRTPPVKLLFQAPPDFAPAFFELIFATGEDGLIAPDGVSMNRVKGNWTNENAKRFDMSGYDIATMMATVSRFASISFAANPIKRLPANMKFFIVLRCNRRSKDGSLAVILKSVSRCPADKTKFKVFTDKTDPVLRRLRRAARVLPSAFTQVQLPPSRRRTNSAEEE